MGERKLSAPGSFASWDSVMRGFQLQARGVNPLNLMPGNWLHLAALEDSRGNHDTAAVYLEAGLLREAYDRDTYEPPAEYQRAYALPADKRPAR